eukprot:m.112930 g.112930  ORF g.112930 m.112930 type:complete len:514 (-) comp10790_c0_seq2:136-1677(-)
MRKNDIRNGFFGTIGKMIVVLLIAIGCLDVHDVVTQLVGWSTLCSTVGHQTRCVVVGSEIVSKFVSQGNNLHLRRHILTEIDHGGDARVERAAATRPPRTYTSRCGIGRRNPRQTQDAAAKVAVRKGVHQAKVVPPCIRDRRVGRCRGQHVEKPLSTLGVGRAASGLRARGTRGLPGIRVARVRGVDHNTFGGKLSHTTTRLAVNRKGCGAVDEAGSVEQTQDIANRCVRVVLSIGSKPGIHEPLVNHECHTTRVLRRIVRLGRLASQAVLVLLGHKLCLALGQSFVFGSFKFKIMRFGLRHVRPFVNNVGEIRVFQVLVGTLNEILFSRRMNHSHQHVVLNLGRYCGAKLTVQTAMIKNSLVKVGEFNSPIVCVYLGDKSIGKELGSCRTQYCLECPSMGSKVNHHRRHLGIRILCHGTALAMGIVLGNQRLFAQVQRLIVADPTVSQRRQISVDCRGHGCTRNHNRGPAHCWTAHLCVCVCRVRALARVEPAPPLSQLDDIVDNMSAETER